MKKLYLIRHGETESNRKGIFRGRLDIPLSTKGREQAEGLKEYFKNISIDTLYSSPLGRAKETAEIALPGHHVIVEPMLNNLDLGDWSGMNKASVKEKLPGMWEQWITHPETIAFPGGEALDDVLQRSKRFLETAVAGEGECIAVVSHRSVVKVILAAAIGLEKDYYWKFHLDNASVSLVYFEPGRGFTLVKINDTHHLKGTVMEWY
jgi:phosphoserine phosphatase